MLWSVEGWIVLWSVEGGVVLWSVEGGVVLWSVEGGVVLWAVHQIISTMHQNNAFVDCDLLKGGCQHL